MSGRAIHFRRGPAALLAVCLATYPTAAFATSLNWNVGAGGLPTSGNWDTATANWTTAAPTYIAAGTSPNTYTDGGVDTVTFQMTTTNGTAATITLPGGGLTPQAINVTGTANTGIGFTFSGGPILGSAPLNVSTSQNTAGVGPATIFTVASPSWTGPITVGNSTTAGNFHSDVTGAWGTGKVTLQGSVGTGAFLKFGTTTSQTVANDVEFKGGFTGSIQGNGVSTQTLQGYSASAGTAGYKITFTGNITGNDDNLRLFGGGTGQSRVIEIRPGAGKSVTGTGSTSIQSQALSISNSNQMFSGNLNLSSNGTFIFDNMSYASWGRTPGTGAGQWQISAAGGAFAARGLDVTITSVPTTLLDSNIGIGYNDVSYADKSVKIQSGNTLTMSANRQIWAWGGASANPNVTTGVTYIGPVNEIADAINSGGFALTVASNAGAGLNAGVGINAANSQAGGVLRLSNASNNIATLNIGTTTAGAVVLTNTGAGGGGTINVGSNGAGGTGGYLFFEDTTGTGTTFNNNFNVNVLDTSGNWNNAGFGAIGGMAVFTGTATLTTPSTLTTQGSVSVNFMPMNVTAGSLTLGNSTTAAKLTNNRALNYSGAGSAGNPTPYNGIIYLKNSTGEVVLNNIDYSLGSNANGWKWRVTGGIITTQSMGLIASPGGLLSNTNIIPSDIVGQNTSAGRGWRTTTVAQSYTTNGGVNPTGDFLFDTQSDLTLDQGAGSFFGGTSGAQTFRKTGSGTLMFKSVTGLAANGDTTDFFQIEAGTLDVKGNTGNTSFRIQGGTLLSADGIFSGFSSGRTLEITSAGGKLGVSVNAAANVTRSAVINTWTQGGTVTFASRDNLNLALTNASFQDITAGTVLFQRDGTGTGVVQIDDTAVAVSGAGTRVGGSGSVKFGSTGTGTWTFNGGTLAPGSSPGRLTVDGNIALTTGSTFEVELNGTTVVTQYDQLALTNNAARTISLGNSTLSVLLGFPALSGQTFTIIDNQRTTGGTTGVFNYNAAPLPEGAAFQAYIGLVPYGFTISYVGGTGNDVVLTSTGEVPEPASAALLAIGALAVARRTRRARTA